MAYNFLAMTNKVLVAVNEPELTTTNFNDVVGFSKYAKQSVNLGLAEIINAEDYWKFAYTEFNGTFVAGISRYNYPVNSSTIDFDSFVIKRDVGLNNPSGWLRPIDYDEYVQNYIGDEYAGTDTVRNQPKVVTEMPNYQYSVWPVPKEAYPYRFNYFATYTELENHNDIPLVPERWSHVLYYASMVHAWTFRDNADNAQKAEAMFTKYMKKMREREINVFKDLRSTVIHRDYTGN